MLTRRVRKRLTIFIADQGQACELVGSCIDAVHQRSSFDSRACNHRTAAPVYEGRNTHSSQLLNLAALTIKICQQSNFVAIKKRGRLALRRFSIWRNVGRVRNPAGHGICASSLFAGTEFLVTLELRRKPAQAHWAARVNAISRSALSWRSNCCRRPRRQQRVWLFYRVVTTSQRRACPLPHCEAVQASGRAVGPPEDARRRSAKWWLGRRVGLLNEVRL